jgi:hypothetical protein
MKDVEQWKKEGFAFELRFAGEYDLWVNRYTMQKLRRHVDGSEWLSDLSTGEYERVQPGSTQVVCGKYLTQVCEHKSLKTNCELCKRDDRIKELETCIRRILRIEDKSGVRVRFDHARECLKKVRQ